MPLLERAACTAITPTLSGSGSRAALLSPAIDLATHVADVIECIQQIDDEPIVLVGHSYAGMVLAGVAEQLGHRLSAAVFVDAFYPEDGRAAIDRMPGPVQQIIREQARALGDGWRLPASDELLDVWDLRAPMIGAGSVNDSPTGPCPVSSRRHACRPGAFDRFPAGMWAAQRTIRPGRLRRNGTDRRRGRVRAREAANGTRRHD